MSASSAPCAVSCRGRASSSSREPVIANGRTSRSASARASARSAAWCAARWSPSSRWASPASRSASTTVTYPTTGAVPSRTSASTPRAPAGSPSARQITARASRISPEPARSSSTAASTARASPGLPRRAWVASSQPVTWLASACDPSSCDPRRSAALNSSSASWWRPRPACSIPVVWCSSSLMSGPVSVCRARAARRSHRSPSSNSPVHTIVPASVTSAGAITGSVAQPYRSASAIASRQRRWVVANGWIFDANPSCARQPTSR